MKQHFQKEAYHLMVYASASGVQREVLWNSRDGITPFVVQSLDNRTEMTHVEWQNDRYEPFYIPPIGSRIFMDLNEERARASAEEYVEKYWEARDVPMSRMWETKQIAIDHFVEEWLQNWGGHSPEVVVVTPALHAMFTSRAKSKHL